MMPYMAVRIFPIFIYICLPIYRTRRFALCLHVFFKIWYFGIFGITEHKPAAKFHAFRVSKFKHLSGNPTKRDQNIENIKNFDQSLSHESNGLQAYNDLVAYPVAGPGGQIAVVKVR